MEILLRDKERTWIVCQKCGGAFDARKGGKCKCDNVKAGVIPGGDGAVMIVADDDDAVVVDNERYGR